MSDGSLETIDGVSRESEPKALLLAKRQSFKTYVWLICAGIFLIVSRGMIDFNSPDYAGFDLHYYRTIAIASPHLSKDASAPYAYRLLGPYIVGLLPLPDPLAFRLVDSIACLALVILFYRLLVGQGITSRVAFVAVLLFACNRYFFGLLIWDPFQIDDVLAMVCLVVSLMFLFRRRWVGFALCFALGCVTREAVMILIPVSFLYLWEEGALRHEYKKWIAAIVPALAVFILVRMFVYADDVRMGITGILPYYQMKFGESAVNAYSKHAWFRRLIWSFMPFTPLPFVFPRTTISFFWRRKFVLLFFVLVVITDLWGIDHGGGDAERQMAPAFLPFFWLIAMLLQQELSHVKWALPAILAGGYISSLHHLQGIYPLPNKLATLLVTVVAVVEILAVALYVKCRGRVGEAGSAAVL
jgi:uncharacterized membrane protein